MISILREFHDFVPNKDLDNSNRPPQNPYLMESELIPSTGEDRNFNLVEEINCLLRSKLSES